MSPNIYSISQGYSIELITNLQRFYHLQPTWDSVLQKNSSYVPFLCYDWFKIWIHHFLNQHSLFILVLYKKDEPVLIAPFTITPELYKNTITLRHITLIGNIHSPIRNFIITDLQDENPSVWLSHVLTFFHKQFTAWDLITVDSIPEEAGFDILSQTIISLGFRNRPYVSFPYWSLENITYSGSEYIKGLPRKVRNEIKRRQKRLSELGKVRIEIGTDQLNFDYHMHLYHKVRQKSWKSPESDSAFHYDIRKMAAEKAWLRCGFLFLDSRPIAAQIRFVANRTAYFMEALHDTEFNKFAPGTLLRSELIKYFIDNDCITRIDHGRGDESYKAHWTPIRRLTRGITIFNNNSKGKLLALLMTQLLPVFQKTPLLSSVKNKLANIFTNSA